MKLSIIIPVYNAEAYIEDCLRSVLNQNIDPSEYEIVLINDGSEDNSAGIIGDYLHDHAHIKLINQSNMGNGGARNTGVTFAQGKYVYFLDADDYLAHNSLGNILDLAIREDLDLLGFDSLKVSESESVPNFEKAHYNIEKIEDGVTFIADNEFKPEVWWYLIKKSFLKKTGLKFYDRRFIQDAYYTPTLFLAANKVAYVPLQIHRYRQSSNSITRNDNMNQLKRHLQDMLFSIKKLDGLIQSLKTNSPKTIKARKRLHRNKQRYAFLLYTRITRSDLKSNEVNAIRRELIRLGAYPIGNFNGLYYGNWIYTILRVIFNNQFLFLTAKRAYSIINR